MLIYHTIKIDDFNNCVPIDINGIYRFSIEYFDFFSGEKLANNALNQNLIFNTNSINPLLLKVLLNEEVVLTNILVRITNLLVGNIKGNYYQYRTDITSICRIPDNTTTSNTTTLQTTTTVNIQIVSSVICPQNAIIIDSINCSQGAIITDEIICLTTTIPLTTTQLTTSTTSTTTSITTTVFVLPDCQVSLDSITVVNSKVLSLVITSNLNSQAPWYITLNGSIVQSGQLDLDDSTGNYLINLTNNLQGNQLYLFTLNTTDCTSSTILQTFNTTGLTTTSTTTIPITTTNLTTTSTTQTTTLQTTTINYIEECLLYYCTGYNIRVYNLSTQQDTLVYTNNRVFFDDITRIANILYLKGGAFYYKFDLTTFVFSTIGSIGVFGNPEPSLGTYNGKMLTLVKVTGGLNPIKIKTIDVNTLAVATVCTINSIFNVSQGDILYFNNEFIISVYTNSNVSKLLFIALNGTVNQEITTSIRELFGIFYIGSTLYVTGNIGTVYKVYRVDRINSVLIEESLNLAVRAFGTTQGEFC